MKGTVKLKKRLEALGLALLFMLQSVLGFLPGMIFSAAGAVKSIEVWDSDQLIDYGYRFNMKFQPGVTTYESFGCDNLDSAAFSEMCIRDRGTVGDGQCNISLGTSGTVFISSKNFGVDENNALHSFCHADGSYH